MFDELLSPLLTTTWGRRAGLGVILLMGVLLFVTLLQTLFTWHADFKLAHQSPPSHIKTLTSDDVSTLIAHIPEHHLFGKYGVVDDSAVPITSLQLHLVGVIKATPDKFSRVIISEAGQPAKVYQLGDSLSSGVKIYAIAPDGVILENAGRLEKLPLPRPALEYQGMPKPLKDTEEE